VFVKNNDTYIAELEELTANMVYHSRNETHINESVEGGNQDHESLMNAINHQAQSHPPPNSTITNKEHVVLLDWNNIVSSIGDYIYQARNINQEDRHVTERNSTAIRVDKVDRNKRCTSIFREEIDKIIEQPVNQIDLEMMKQIIDDEAKKAEDELIISGGCCKWIMFGGTFLINIMFYMSKNCVENTWYNTFGGSINKIVRVSLVYSRC